jgi:hypothetical protein
LIDRQGDRRPANELAIARVKSAFHAAGLDFPEAFERAEEVRSNDTEKVWKQKQILEQIATHRRKHE